MRKKELTISDKLDIIAMQPMTRETMKFICEIDEEVNLKDYKLRKYKEVLDKIKEYIDKYESIRAYYEYLDGEYWETDYDDDFKEEILELLEEIE